jgi:hypothetical protein
MTERTITVTPSYYRAGYNDPISERFFLGADLDSPSPELVGTFQSCSF